MIYLASPYSDPNADVREYRYQQTCDFVAKKLLEGYVIFSPVVYSHGFACDHPEMGSSWAHWSWFDEQFIKMCSEMWVLKLKGWKQNEGVKKEVDLAMLFHKPIKETI